MYKPIPFFSVLILLMSWPIVEAIAFNPLDNVDIYECLYDEPWTPTQAEFEKILLDHLAWLKDERKEQIAFLSNGSTRARDYLPKMSAKRQAKLCNAQLTHVSFADAIQSLNVEVLNLAWANLNGANLKGAKLNGADLGFAVLNGANLAYADLNGANLGGAKLNGANLEGANLRGVVLTGASLNCFGSGADKMCAILRGADLRCLNAGTDKEKCADLNGAQLNGATLDGAMLNGANLRGVELIGAMLSFAVLNGVDLSDANLTDATLAAVGLNGAILRRANLNGALLPAAQLNGANLAYADLSGANLRSANLNGAIVRNAKLTGADLTNANMSEADLTNATLSRAKLIDTKLLGAVMNGVQIDGATYEPFSLPNSTSLTNIFGVSSVQFDGNKAAGVVQLREAYKRTGNRDAERDATYLIKRNERIHHRDNGGLMGSVESGFSYIMFEATTEWGRKPGQALLIILVVFLIVIPVYTVAILIGPTSRSVSGIYKIEPKGRMVFSEGTPLLLEQDRVEPLEASWGGSIAYGAYFSLLSAFQLGWRELNVGAWISRLQPTELSLRASGWVRVVSGCQSLLSVYLLAMWALTYFGRPFG